MAVEATETTITSEAPVSFQDAFQAAVKEHTPVEPAKAEPVAEKPVETKTEAPAETGLISDEEYTALETKHKGDPIALRKDLERVFTQKTQKLAEQRKRTERLSGYETLIDAYEADPQAVIRKLAAQHGLALAEAKAAVESVVDGPKPAPKLSEFDYDTERWGEAMSQWAKAEAKREALSEFDQRVKPIQAQTQTLVEKVANEQTDAVLGKLTELHADWKEHEDTMFALMQQIEPKGMGELEYLDKLYKLATYDKWEADREANIDREANGRFKKLTEKIDGSTPEKQVAAVPESQVRKRPEGRVSFTQAFQDAKAGIRYDD